MSSRIGHNDLINSQLILCFPKLLSSTLLNSRHKKQFNQTIAYYTMVVCANLVSYFNGAVEELGFVTKKLLQTCTYN